MITSASEAIRKDSTVSIRSHLRTPSVAGFLVLVLGISLAAGCATSGPAVIDPDRDFAGLRDILANLPDDGTLEVFLAHGMRADAPQTYADVIGAITKRLNLFTAEDSQSLPPIPLGLEPPNVVLDGVPVFGKGSTDGNDWKQFQPRVTVEH